MGRGNIYKDTETYTDDGVPAGAQSHSNFQIGNQRRQASEPETPTSSAKTPPNTDASSSSDYDPEIERYRKEVSGPTLPIHEATKRGDIAEVKALLDAGEKINARDENGDTPLHLAADGGHKDLVVELARLGAKIDLANANGAVPLHSAAIKGYADVITELAKVGTDVNIRGIHRKGTALHQAAGRGHLNAVKELVRLGAKVDSEDVQGSTPLIMAAIDGKLAEVIFLLDNGASLLHLNHEGGGACYYAAFKGHTEVVRELIKRGADVNQLYTAQKLPSLIAAVDKKHSETVRALVELGGDVNHVLQGHCSPFMFACYRGHVDMVKMMLPTALINDTSNPHGTPLHFAACGGNLPIVQILLERGAIVGALSPQKCTPLDMAAFNGHVDAMMVLLKNTPRETHAMTSAMLSAAEGGRIAALRALLNEGIDVNIDKDGVTPLRKVVCAGSLEAFELLMQKGADVTVLDSNNNNLLHIAATENQANMVAPLVKLGVNIDARNKVGATPVYVASMNGKVEVLKELIACGAKVHIVKKEAITPLHAAAQQGHVEAMKVLLAHGAVLNAKALSGHTPLVYAAVGGQVGAVRELLAQGSPINMYNESTETLTPILYYGVEGKNYEVVKELLAHGADIHALNHMIRWHKKLNLKNDNERRIYELLIEYGAKPANCVVQ